MNVLGGTKSNITQRLNYLEKKGFVTRSQEGGKADKRKVSIFITSAGQQAIKEASYLIRDKSQALHNVFSEEEINAHLKFMKKLRDFLITNYKETGCQANEQ
jgi:DNA-binding MarR family transcriptional regulator